MFWRIVLCLDIVLLFAMISMPLFVIIVQKKEEKRLIDAFDKIIELYASENFKSIK